MLDKTSSSKLSGMSSLGGQGTIRWFDPIRGFGFIIPSEPLPDGRDVLLLKSVVQKSGFVTIDERTVVTFDAQKNKGGYSASCIRLLDTSRAISRAESCQRKEELRQATTLSSVVPATVKWFDKNRGYGFFDAHEAGLEEDIYFHITDLERAGITYSPQSGQKAEVRYGPGRKKKFSAIEIKFV